MKTLSQREWQAKAERRLQKIIRAVQAFSGLAKLGPKTPWSVEVKLVGSPAMIRLNTSYRGKRYATDVLSFPTVPPFRQAGYLGELVICLPTLKAQAKRLGCSPEQELEVLLIHGVLHLLGLDHEKGPRQAATMARWEGKVIQATLPVSASKRLLGLIDRSHSGIEGA